MKIIEYKVIDSHHHLGETSRAEIGREVNALIQDGWQPLGGLSERGQVMVRYE